MCNKTMKRPLRSFGKESVRPEGVLFLTAKMAAYLDVRRIRETWRMID